MFHLNKGAELTPALLHKMIERFRLNVEPKLNKYKNYYDGNTNMRKYTENQIDYYLNSLKQIFIKC